MKSEDIWMDDDEDYKKDLSIPCSECNGKRDDINDEFCESCNQKASR